MSVLPAIRPTTLPDGRMATIRALTGADADALSDAVRHADSRDPASSLHGVATTDRGPA
jgi:hypothetical protein